MSNLICHAKQKTVINLDNVSSLFHNPDYKVIYFSYPAMNNDEVSGDEWKFESQEEANKVYNSILDRFSSEIVGY